MKIVPISIVIMTVMLVREQMSVFRVSDLSSVCLCPKCPDAG
jgi:hypothetical protein